jgi:hypothetical protein
VRAVPLSCAVTQLRERAKRTNMLVYTVKVPILCAGVVNHVLPRQVGPDSVDLWINWQLSADVTVKRKSNNISYLQVGNVYIV